MSELDTINYQPLLILEKAWPITFKKSLQGWPLLGVICGLVAAVLSLLFGYYDLTAAIIVIYLMVLSYVVNRAKNAAWRNFAQVNDWPFDTSTPLDVVIPPSIQFGHNPVVSPVIQAQFGDLACDILTYSCKTGSGKYQQTHQFTVASLTLPQALPHILLLSKKANADVRRDLVNAEKLNLEGDFDDYFSLQIDKGQEVDVLTILTPDVMQSIVDYDQTEDVEMLERNLYFIARNDKRDVHDMQLLFHSVVELSQQIMQNISHTTTVQ